MRTNASGRRCPKMSENVRSGGIVSISGAVETELERDSRADETNPIEPNAKPRFQLKNAGMCRQKRLASDETNPLRAAVVCPCPAFSTACDSRPESARRLCDRASVFPALHNKRATALAPVENFCSCTGFA